MPVNNPVTDASVMDIVVAQESIVDNIYDLIYGPVPMDTTEAKLMPSSVLTDMRDRLLDNNLRLSRLLEHLKVLR